MFNTVFFFIILWNCFWRSIFCWLEDLHCHCLLLDNCRKMWRYQDIYFSVFLFPITLDFLNCIKCSWPGTEVRFRRCHCSLLSDCRIVNNQQQKKKASTHMSWYSFSHHPCYIAEVLMRTTGFAHFLSVVIETLSFLIIPLCLQEFEPPTSRLWG